MDKMARPIPRTSKEPKSIKENIRLVKTEMRKSLVERTGIGAPSFLDVSAKTHTGFGDIPHEGPHGFA